MTWLIFVLLTVACWGVYGICLHSGAMGMKDPDNGRMKAFLLVGVAYFLVAVLAPLAYLMMQGASWGMPGKGVTWSLIAGTVGAIGAFGVLLAFGAKGNPTVVMSIIFAGAPIVNAVVAIIMHPPEGGVTSLRLPFIGGILMAALGGFLVYYYKPPPPTKKPPSVSTVPSPPPATPDARDAGR